MGTEASVYNITVHVPAQGQTDNRLRLGHATTRQLLDEVTARIEVDGKLDYSTVNGVPDPEPGEVRTLTFGDQVEDGGRMGTIVRCETCGGSGQLHDPDERPPFVEASDDRT